MCCSEWLDMFVCKCYALCSQAAPRAAFPAVAAPPVSALYCFPAECGVQYACIVVMYVCICLLTRLYVYDHAFNCGHRCSQALVLCDDCVYLNARHVLTCVRVVRYVYVCVCMCVCLLNVATDCCTDSTWCCSGKILPPA